MSSASPVIKVICFCEHVTWVFLIFREIEERKKEGTKEAKEWSQSERAGGRKRNFTLYFTS